MDYMERSQFDYGKLTIHPFYSFEPIRLPHWYKTLLFEALVDVYLHWHKSMSSTGEGFYLKLWVFDPNFIRSQVVTAYRDKLDKYDNTFEAPVKDKPFPFNEYPSLKEKLEQFDWSLKNSVSAYLDSELQSDVALGIHTDKEVQLIKQKAYKTEDWTNFENTPDKWYYVRADKVWLGTLR